MPIGDLTYVLEKTWFRRWFTRLLGVTDFHSHLRIAPVLETFERLRFGDPSPLVVELGCGMGLNLFEIDKYVPLHAVGIDSDEKAIAKAKLVRDAHSLDRITFICADARTAPTNDRIDCVLLIDVLEHVRDPGRLLTDLDTRLAPGGYLLISVPTPLYPRIFGKQFHGLVGHLVDGYLLRDVSGLLPAGYRIVEHRYNTGVLTWPACFLYYRFLRKLRRGYAQRLAAIALLPFRFLDFFNGSDRSASLFAVVQKAPYQDFA